MWVPCVAGASALVIVGLFYGLSSWMARKTRSAMIECKGDLGECAHNGACMYACGRQSPPLV